MSLAVGVHAELGESLYRAMRERLPLPPLTQTHPDISGRRRLSHLARYADTAL